MRLLCALALTLSVGLLAAYADDKKEPPKKEGDRSAKLAELSKKYDTELKVLFEKFQSAKTAAEKNAIRTEARELSVLSAAKALKLAEENPKDEAALEAAIFVIQKPGRFARGQEEVGKAFKLITANHLNNPKVKELLLIAGQFGPDGEKLLKSASEKSTDKDVKGIALFSLGKMYAAQVDDVDDDKEAAALNAKAIATLELAAKEAPDAKIAGKALGTLAKSEIASIKATGIGNPAPDVASVDIDGKKVKLGDYKGKVVLLDIWATWCPPCRAMIPHEREMVKKLKDKPFQLVSVSADDEKKTLTDFLKSNEMPWVHWWDGAENKVLQTFKVRAFPTLYLIDHKGVIRRKWIGSPKSAVLDDAIAELVKEAEKDTKKPGTK